MNIEQSEEYRNAVIASAKAWVSGESSIGDQMELCVIADYYNIDLPGYFHHFRSSYSPGMVCATGAHKSILKKLKKLADAIIKAEGMAL